MRMPPYMRDSDETSLSLTHQQYALVLALARHLSESKVVSGGLSAHASPAEQRVAAHVARLRMAPPAAAPRGHTT
jgi:hypothetical protein